MKACALEAIGKLNYKDVLDPQLKQDGAIVQLRACGICSSDYQRFFVSGAYKFPTILGHEFSGVVVSVGDKANETFLGRRVVVFPLLPCFHCDSCISKRWQQCERYGYFGSRNDGGFAEYISVPIWNLLIVPDSLDFRVAALTEPMAVAIHAVKKSLQTRNSIKSIAIYGSGTIAIMAALYAKSIGFSPVVFCRSSAKEAFLSSLGISACLLGKDNRRFDACLECVGSVDSIVHSLDLVNKGGVLSLVGNPRGDLTLTQSQYWKILRSELAIVGCWNSTWKSDREDDWVDAVNVLTANQAVFRRLITQVYSLSQGDLPFLNYKRFQRSGTLFIKQMYDIGSI